MSETDFVFTSLNVVSSWKRLCLSSVLVGALACATPRAEAKKPNDGAAVSLRFCGDLASIMALGVEINGPVWGSGSVSVIVRYSDLQRIVEHPGVLWLAAGEKPHID